MIFLNVRLTNVSQLCRPQPNGYFPKENWMHAKLGHTQSSEAFTSLEPQKLIFKLDRENMPQHIKIRLIYNAVERFSSIQSQIQSAGSILRAIGEREQAPVCLTKKSVIKINTIIQNISPD